MPKLQVQAGSPCDLPALDETLFSPSPHMTSLRRPTPPELLAPTGSAEQRRAAIENGADAVYFGLTSHNARFRAHAVSLEALPEVMAELHERGVKGFVTLNTLIFEEELAGVERLLGAVSDAGVDAVIVQDLGVARMMKACVPDLPLHGSTQMTVTSAEGAALVAELGVERIVLARELSLDDIRRIREATALELEVFVHGALCVSYSGQCFSSEAWGGRSANRGQCAQACRLPYTLEVDGREHSTEDAPYVLSPQDLMGLQHIEALVELGVSCFKVEGRLKSPEYVALTTAAYRRAIDRVWRGLPHTVETREVEALTQVFSRGLTPGFLEGPRHQQVVRGRAPRHRGLRIGRVLRAVPGGVEVELEGPCKAGDGVVFDQARAQDDEVGGRIFQVMGPSGALEGEHRSGRVVLRFGNHVPVQRVQPGDWLWRTRDEALEVEARRSWEQGIQRRAEVRVEARGEAGTPLELRWTDDAGHQVTVVSNDPLQPARNTGLDEALLRRSLERLGETPFVLGDVAVSLAPGLFLAPSALNALRRQATDALLDLRREPPQRRRSAVEVLESLQSPQDLERTSEAAGPPQLHLLCRTPQQVDAALALPDTGDLYLDFLEVRGVREAVQRVARAGRRAVAVTPRVLKPNEERISRFYLGLGAHGLLVRSLGMLWSLQAQQAGDEGPELIGDFSLNATNSLTATTLLDLGLTRLAPGHDLNGAQLADLVTRLPADRVEVIAHHHLPVFHTEHCVFARYMSEGEDFRTCGRPCEHHDVALVDVRGKRHRVLADMGCRNTVFNGEAQSAALFLPALREAGARHFRLELLDHGADEVGPLQDAWWAALRGEVSAEETWRWLVRKTRTGATLGSLHVPGSPASV